MLKSDAQTIRSAIPAASKRRDTAYFLVKRGSESDAPQENTPLLV